MKSLDGAQRSTHAWLTQRVTALALAVLMPLLLGRVLLALPLDHAGWQSLFAPTWVRVAWVFAGFALAWHAWLGMRDILLDYVRPFGLRLALHLAVLALLAASLAGLILGMVRTT